jgi:hypothetical protein
VTTDVSRPLPPAEAIDDSTTRERAVWQDLEAAGPVKVQRSFKRVALQSGAADIEAEVVDQTSTDMSAPCSRIDGEVSDDGLHFRDSLNPNEAEDDALICLVAQEIQRTVRSIFSCDGRSALQSVRRFAVDLGECEEADNAWVLGSAAQVGDSHGSILEPQNVHDSLIASPQIQRIFDDGVAIPGGGLMNVPAFLKGGLEHHGD